jgi:response regulator of citrate/malate metabolism
MPVRILDVGQCGFDGPRIMQLLEEQLNAKVDTANTAAETKHKVAKGKYDLILVNRLLAADQSSGTDLIGDLVRSGVRTPVMLVSDLQEAQDEAVANGAVQGFGKAVLEDEETLALIARTAGAADA